MIRYVVLTNTTDVYVDSWVNYLCSMYDRFV